MEQTPGTEAPASPATTAWWSSVKDRVSTNVLLAAFAVLIYVWAVPFGLLRIDDLVQYHADLLHDGGWYGLIDVWLRPWFYDYSPVTETSQWLDRALGDDGNRWYCARMQNALWLGFGAVAIRAFLGRITGAGIAFAVAALYVCHPLCADGTLWLAERKNLVAIALSFWCCERYVAYRRGIAGLGAGVAACVLGILALLAKPHAVAIPVMLAAWEVVLGADGQGLDGALRQARSRGAGLVAACLSSARRAWPAIILTVAVAVFVVMQITMRKDIGAALLGGSRGAAAWCDGWILARYLGMVVVPRNLTLYYPVIEDPRAVQVLGLCWAAVAAAVVVTVALARRRRLVVFAWAFAVAALLPALNLVAQNVPMTDYYVQWALPGLLLVIVVVGADLLARGGTQAARGGPMLVTVAAIGCAVLSLLRVPEFVSRDVFFQVAFRRQPDTAVNIGGQVYDLVRYHDARYGEVTGALALQAAALPSVRRMLAFTVPDTAIEAGVAAWRIGGQAEAAAAVGCFPVPGPDTDIGTLVVARVLIGASSIEPKASHLKEAEALLIERLSAPLVAAADTVGKRCADGAIFPDSFPPVLADLPAPAGADAFLVHQERHDHVRLLLVLADARERSGDGAGAISAAALALNLDPTDGESRVVVAGLYGRVMHRSDLAQRLLNAGH